MKAKTSQILCTTKPQSPLYRLGNELCSQYIGLLQFVAKDLKKFGSKLGAFAENKGIRELKE